jgi:hypothetical protein
MKHSLKVYLRLFHIWQVLGENPWKKQRTSKKEGKDFYKGAFDSIPFLNDDAKRTFVHLLLRPGYMIRDYVGGKHDRYLAPLAALIIFYAFFTLISSALQPLETRKEEEKEFSIEMKGGGDDEVKSTENDNVYKILIAARKLVKLPYLDKHPEEVDSRPKAILAAIEGSLRSKGITLFLGSFFLLWFSMRFAMRKDGVSWSAAAAASAYVLCQLSFFMLFAVLLSGGKNDSVGYYIQAIILVVDYKQWLSLAWRKSIGRTIKTSIYYGLIWLLFWVLLGVVILCIALASGVVSLDQLISFWSD